MGIFLFQPQLSPRAFKSHHIFSSLQQSRISNEHLWAPPHPHPSPCQPDQTQLALSLCLPLPPPAGAPCDGRVQLGTLRAARVTPELWSVMEPLPWPFPVPRPGVRITPKGKFVILPGSQETSSREHIRFVRRKKKSSQIHSFLQESSQSSCHSGWSRMACAGNRRATPDLWAR